MATELAGAADMIDRRRLLPTLLLGAALVLLAIWYRSLEWETKQIDRGPTAEARQNPVLALQRLLELRQVPVTLVRGFGSLERLELNNTQVSYKDTLVLLNTGNSLRESQVDTLWRWMENGGRLLVTADNPFFAMDQLDDPLLDRVGLTLTSDYWDLVEEEENIEETSETAAPSGDDLSTGVNDDEGESDTNSTAGSLCTWRSVTLPVSLPGYSGESLMMEFDSGMSFIAQNSDARALASYQDQIFLARHSVGAGEIYLLPSLEPLQNHIIHCQDNAFVFWTLLKDSSHVWLVHNADSPSFWRYLWQFSTLGCVLLLTALAVWLWHRVPRFGPVLTQHTQERRQFMDHIHASAQFILRHRGNSALIETLREDLWQRLRLRHPGLERLDQAAQVEHIQQYSGMAAADVQLALFRSLPVPPPVFVETVQRLQHLRNTL